MWILVIYIGVGFTVGQMPQGGPTTAEFQSQQACEAALKQIQESFGEEREHDRRFQPGKGGETRIWTIKGVCVAK